MKLSSVSSLVRRGEDYLFAWAARAEYRLKIAPRGTRLVATTLHRWILRALLAGVLALVVVMAFTSGATRTRSILVIALGGLLAALALLWWDARVPTQSNRRGAAGKGVPPLPPPPKRTPSTDSGGSRQTRK